MLEKTDGGVVLLVAVAPANGSFGFGTRAERRVAVGAGGAVGVGCCFLRRCVRRWRAPRGPVRFSYVAGTLGGSACNGWGGRVGIVEVCVGTTLGTGAGTTLGVGRAGSTLSATLGSGAVDGGGKCCGTGGNGTGGIGGSVVHALVSNVTRS